MKKRLIRWMSTWPFWLKNIVYTVWLKTTRAGRVANERERLVVASWDELVGCGEFYHVMHGHRYHWAAQLLIPPELILDLGCGSGYGAWYLSSLGHQTIGYDVDEESISWAKDHFKNVNLQYSYALDPDSEYEVIVCFEVLEHAPDSVLDTIKRHLKPGGTLILSTPNAEPVSVRQWLLDRKKVKLNHTHIKEYTHSELIELLSPFFKLIVTYGQCPNDVRNFYDYEEWRRTQDVKLTDFSMDSQDFTNCEVIVAVCRGHRK